MNNFAPEPDIAKQLSWRTRVLIMIGAARGLNYLHSNNFRLGGLKPSNILLDEVLFNS
ncbi:putative protein kinase [Helianthus anomalus]